MSGGIILALILLGLLFSFLKNTSSGPIPLISPTPSPVIDKQKKYLDEMTQKCYDDQEKEVSCKG